MGNFPAVGIQLLQSIPGLISRQMGQCFRAHLLQSEEVILRPEVFILISFRKLRLRWVYLIGLSTREPAP